MGNRYSVLSVCRGFETNRPGKRYGFGLGRIVLDDQRANHVLDLAADNDVRRFKMAILGNPEAFDEVGSWYGRRAGTRTMVLEDRIPLMVAAEYGSVEVIEAILSLSERVDLDRSSGLDKCTALHFAVSGGSSRVAGVVKMLILAGADPGLSDAEGRRPFDVINVSRRECQETAIQGSSTTAVSFARSSARDLAGVAIGVSMLMESLSVGCIQLNTGQGYARIEGAVHSVFASLHIHWKSCALYLYPADQLCHHLVHQYRTRLCNDFGPRSRRSYIGRHHTEEPEITWVHPLVNDSPLETGYFYTGANQLVEGSCSNNQSETFDQSDVITWVDQLHLDQIVA
ncbi:Zinc finger CCCH domain-containing protein [Drosera capensis]